MARADSPGADDGDRLGALFPEGDYRFRATLRRSDPRDFFRPQDPTGRVLAERARWVAEEPARYATLEPEGAPLLAEFSDLTRRWNLPGAENVHALATSFEPDILLLSLDRKGAFRLRGGALCFPTGWALEKKIGRTMDVVHAPVPGLNRALAPAIQQVMAKLKPGVAFLRENWGLVATDELNLHPSRHVAPPALPVALDRLWLRVEYQALVKLPQTDGVAFGIRIALHRLDQVARHPASVQLRRSLVSMPAEVAAYKRIETVRADVVRLLESSWS
ncbi:MAG: DUF3445 domain-containing protein [Opitutaceae bacterium]|nr:DUF3445 domain-containing protein [Opitutaceae bacterium]